MMMEMVVIGGGDCDEYGDIDCGGTVGVVASEVVATVLVELSQRN